MSRLTLEEIQQVEFDVLRTIVSVCEANQLRYYLIGGTLLGAVRHRGFIPWDDDVDIAMPRDDFEKLESIFRRNPPPGYAFINWKDNWQIDTNISKVCDMRVVWIQASRPDHKVEFGAYVDIFPLDGVPKGKIFRVIHRYQVLVLRRLIGMHANNKYNHRFWKRAILGCVQAVLNEARVKWLHRKLDELSKKYPIDSSDEVASYLDLRGPHDYMPKSWLDHPSKVVFEGQVFDTFGDYDTYLRLWYDDYMTLPPPEMRTSHHQYTAYWREADSGMPDMETNR